jgi:phosphoglycolate phosphatase
MTRLVLFDIDGTLIRTGGAGVRAFARIFDKHFNARDGFEKLKFAGRTDYGIVREFFDAHQIPATSENFQMFFNEYAVLLEEMLRGIDVTVCPGVREFIARARAVSPAPVVGLLTGNIKRGAEIKLRSVGLWDEFQTGGFADDHEDRNCIAEAARRRGEEFIGGKLRDSEVLVIGDTPLDIRCGRSIGARVLAVGTGGATMEELEQHAPDYLVTTLEDFDERWLSEG